jgi:hypothetical protein
VEPNPGPKEWKEKTKERDLRKLSRQPPTKEQEWQGLSARQRSALRKVKLQTVEENPGPLQIVRLERYSGAAFHGHHQCLQACRDAVLNNGVCVLVPRFGGMRLVVVCAIIGGVDDDLYRRVHTREEILILCKDRFFRKIVQPLDLTRYGIEPNPGPGREEERGQQLIEPCALSPCTMTSHAHPRRFESKNPSPEDGPERGGMSRAVRRKFLVLCTDPECKRTGPHYHLGRARSQDWDPDSMDSPPTTPKGRKSMMVWMRKVSEEKVGKPAAASSVTVPATCGVQPEVVKPSLVPAPKLSPDAPVFVPAPVPSRPRPASVACSSKDHPLSLLLGPEAKLFGAPTSPCSAKEPPKSTDSVAPKPATGPAATHIFLSCMQKSGDVACKKCIAEQESRIPKDFVVTRRKPDDAGGVVDPDGDEARNASLLINNTPGRLRVMLFSNHSVITDPNEWRSLGEFAFDMFAHVFTTRKVMDRTEAPAGRFLRYYTQDTEAAKTTIIKGFVTRPKRKGPHHVFLRMGFDAARVAIVDYHYACWLMDHYNTSWMDPVSEDFKVNSGIINQMRTLSAKYDRIAEVRTDLEVAEDTLFFIFNQFTIRSFRTRCVGGKSKLSFQSGTTMGKDQNIVVSSGRSPLIVV